MFTGSAWAIGAIIGIFLGMCYSPVVAITDQVYRKAFEQAKADLASAVARRAKAQEEAIAALEDSLQLRRTVAALAAVCGEDVEDSMGLTEAVRMVFQTRESWLLVKDVKEQVESLGVSLAGLKNPDASMMSVLNRLVTAKELITGSKKYKHAVTGNIADYKVWKAKSKTESDTPLTEDDIPF